jgi:hypothetical protein
LIERHYLYPTEMMTARLPNGAAALTATWFEFCGRVHGDEPTRSTPIGAQRLAALDQSTAGLTFGQFVVPVKILQRPGLEQDGAGRVVYLDPAIFH